MTTTWPDGVVARYRTDGGATVDVHDTGEERGAHPDDAERAVTASCTGAGCTAPFEGFGRIWYASQPGSYDNQFAEALAKLNRAAQSHAETCRAMLAPAN